MPLGLDRAFSGGPLPPTDPRAPQPRRPPPPAAREARPGAPPPEAPPSARDLGRESILRARTRPRRRAWVDRARSGRAVAGEPRRACPRAARRAPGGNPGGAPRRLRPFPADARARRACDGLRGGAGIDAALSRRRSSSSRAIASASRIRSWPRASMGKHRPTSGGRCTAASPSSSPTPRSAPAISRSPSTGRTQTSRQHSSMLLQMPARAERARRRRSSASCVAGLRRGMRRPTSIAERSAALSTASMLATPGERSSCSRRPERRHGTGAPARRRWRRFPGCTDSVVTSRWPQSWPVRRSPRPGRTIACAPKRRRGSPRRSSSFARTSRKQSSSPPSPRSTRRGHTTSSCRRSRSASRVFWSAWWETPRRPPRCEAFQTRRNRSSSDACFQTPRHNRGVFALWTDDPEAVGLLREARDADRRTGR